MPHVSLEYPSVCGAVSPVILPHEAGKAVEAEMGSFSYLAAVIVENERPREGVVKDVIAKGVLHDFVL